jgi:hypothetical protein
MRSRFLILFAAQQAARTGMPALDGGIEAQHAGRGDKGRRAGSVHAAGDRRVLAAEDAAEIGRVRTWRPNVSKR